VKTVIGTTVSRMTPFDFVITVTLGSAFGRVLTAQEVALVEVFVAFGLLVVLASFWIVDGGNLYVGLGLMAVGAIGTGLINGLLVTRFAINPVVVTLAMYMALQGIYLTLRSTPGGVIFGGVAESIKSRVGIVPVATIVAVVIGGFAGVGAVAAETDRRAVNQARVGLEQAVGIEPQPCDGTGAHVMQQHVRGFREPVEHLPARG
jgi:ribose/xylose/arabinose/galactoside ABC-type transport system permease subunit